MEKPIPTIQSSCESLLFSRDENYKSPESSDCEGYATPLATSLLDISGVTINLPEDTEDNEERRINSGELTPKIRAVSPPVVKQVMFLEKPNILVMTQRELTDEEYNVQRRTFDEETETGTSSEEEFYDVADVHIRDVAQQLLDALVEPEPEQDEERVATPIVADDEQEEESEGSDEAEESGSSTPVLTTQETVVTGTDKEEMDNEDAVIEVTEALIEEVSAVVPETELEVKQEIEEPSVVIEQETEIEDVIPIEEPTQEVEEKVEVPVEEAVEEAIVDIISDMLDAVPEAQIQEEQEEVKDLPVVSSATKEEIVAAPIAVVEEEIQEDLTLLVEEATNDKQETILEAPVAQVLEDACSDIHVAPVHEPLEDDLLTSEPVLEAPAVLETPDFVEIPEEAQDIIDTVNLHTQSEAVELVEEVPLETSPVSQETTAIVNPETAEEVKTIANEPMPTLVISDEVKTSQTTGDDDLSDCSIHEVKVDFDGYSSGKEESLSSSTSSESFEFTDIVPSSNVDEERTQAIRDSINERYPTNASDDEEEELDVGAEYDEDLLAVKQISAEVEQLVAAINAFGRDEEQQMSAYLVGKNMAAEKKRKSAMEGGNACSDQLVQTDNDSFILVDRHLPEAMETLQVEIDRLQGDLEKFKTGEKELLNINAKLREELNESQQTIDGIEVEAEQQYTELTSEIDELCDIVLKKDQELAGLKEKVANLSISEINLKDDVDAQRIIVQRQKEIIEGLREELDAITKKLGEVTKLRDKAIEEATIYKMKNMERERFLSKEAQMSMEIEDLQRELNKQRLILNGTSMAKLADTFDRKVLHLENELRERDMLICKQNQIINSHRKSPTGSIITARKMQPRASVLAAAGNLPSAGSSSESFQNGLDLEAKEALLSFILSDRHNQLANIYNIGRILDLTPQEERAVERHLTKDRFT